MRIAEKLIPKNFIKHLQKFTFPQSIKINELSLII